MKHKKKARTTDRADQFLQAIGTAGGPIGAPQLIGFGGTDVQSQLAAGNRDESYLKLNLPGSPLPANALLAPQNMLAAERNQNFIRSEEQMFLAQYMPAAGLMQLPVGQPPLESGKGKK